MTLGPGEIRPLFLFIACRNARLGGVGCSFFTAWAGSMTPRTAALLPPAKIFTDTRIHRAPDCRITRAERIQLEGMAPSPPFSLSDAEKLELLRRLDQFRHWHSLDDRRYCLVCGKIITGRQIQVPGGTRGNVSLRISCPTERCNSIPMDWVLPTDEILARVEMMVAQEHQIAASPLANHAKARSEAANRGHDGIASRLRRFAFHFKHAS
jgi:hypothetical protein